MKFEFIHSTWTGIIQLGMTQTQIENIIGKTDSPVRNYYNTGFREVYIEKGVNVDYLDPGICQGIEISEPSEAIFNHVNLIGMPFNDAKKMVKQFDPHILIDDTGFTSLKYGFNVYVDSTDEEENLPIEAVIIFSEGYYEHELKLGLLGKPEEGLNE